MLFAPAIADELDPTDSHLTTQNYIFRYCDLCHEQGFSSNTSLTNDEIHKIDLTIALKAKEQGFSDDEIELILWFGSPLAQRLDDDKRDIYAQFFTIQGNQTIQETENFPFKNLYFITRATYNQLNNELWLETAQRLYRLPLSCCLDKKKGFLGLNIFFDYASQYLTDN